MKAEDLLLREDGRVEWLCEHHIGHTIYFLYGSDSIHGCDGCCHKHLNKKVVLLCQKVYGKDKVKSLESLAKFYNMYDEASK